MKTRDLLLIRLANNTPFFTLDQAMHHGAIAGSGSEERSVRGTLGELVTRGFLAKGQVMSRPRLDLSHGPLARWLPGEGMPNFASLAWKVARRWTLPPRKLPVWSARPKALAIFGMKSCRQRIRPLTASHDLHVTEMYLEFLKNGQPDQGQWLTEEELRAFGWKKVPDAGVGTQEQCRLVKDFGGNYPASRLGEFGKLFVSLNLPFEIW